MLHNCGREKVTNGKVKFAHGKSNSPEPENGPGELDGF